MIDFPDFPDFPPPPPPPTNRADFDFNMAIDGIVTEQGYHQIVAAANQFKRLVEEVGAGVRVYAIKIKPEK